MVRGANIAEFVLGPCRAVCLYSHTDHRQCRRDLVLDHPQVHPGRKAEQFAQDPSRASMSSGNSSAIVCAIWHRIVAAQLLKKASTFNKW